MAMCMNDYFDRMEEERLQELREKKLEKSPVGKSVEKTANRSIKKTRKPLIYKGLRVFPVWCARRDLNPHVRIAH